MVRGSVLASLSGVPPFNMLMDRIVFNDATPLITWSWPLGILDLLTEISELGYERKGSFLETGKFCY